MPDPHAIPMLRLNSRVRPEQKDFIKVTAKKINKSEGELIREIIDFYINEK